MTQQGGLRQRGAGASSSAAEESKEGAFLDDDQPISIEELLQQRLAEGPKKVIGLSKNAKPKKDELAKDPYNIRLIYNLAVQYAEENQMDPSTSVLSRAWKRVAQRDKSSDLNESERMHYLMILVDGFIARKEASRVSEIFESIGAPADVDEQLVVSYWVMAVKVYAMNGNYAKTVNAFNTVLEGRGFEEASMAWASTNQYLVGVGAAEVCESKVKAMATEPEQKNRLEQLGKIVQLQAAVIAETERKQQSFKGMPVEMVRKISWLFLAFGVVGAYLMQTEDFASLVNLLFKKFGLK